MNATDSTPAEIRIQPANLAHATWSLRIFRIVLRSLFRLFFRVRIKGLENVPDRPVIICANHLGWTDAFLILLFLPIEPRIYILGERQVAYISGFRYRLINWMQVMVPLDRDKPREALRVMSDVLKDGGSLLISPEGRLGAAEGEIQPLQHGASHLSLHAGTPVLPVGLTGSKDLWFRRTLTVRIGEALQPDSVSGDLRTRTSTLTWRLEHELRTLLPGDTEHTYIRLLNRWLTNLL